MRNPFQDEMFKATRLTTAGRLGEATALLQKLLRVGTQTRTSRSKSAGRTSKGGHSPITIDAVAIENVSDKVVATAEAASDFGPAAKKDGAPEISRPLSGVLKPLQLDGAVLAPRVVPKPSPPEADVVPSVGQFIARSFSNEAGSRAYKLYVPSRHREEHRPLIVMLHGCTQSADDFAAGTRMNFAAEEHACFVVYPEQARAANSSKCWNWFNSADQQRGMGEPALIAGLTRQVAAEFKIDPRRIYIAGLSAGGAAAAVIAEAYPDLYAAVGVHSGLACGVARDLPSAFVAMQGQHPELDPKRARNASNGIQMPTIAFHGDGDRTVHPRNGNEVIARAEAGGDFETVVEIGSSTRAGHRYTRSIKRDAQGRRIVEHWVIHGAGHAWSGGSPSGSFTDPQGPDATKEMLQFFLEHVREPVEAKAG
jgi:poly(hydroxyalkanoate) depolymerase family esterase